ncbi:MAG: tetratricopeptide repeat protein, partial [Deltaproteobacteria bacterium]|nr:tetratricopeptide repeat protein [Deltaproteobacteria bacterium]
MRPFSLLARASLLLACGSLCTTLAQPLGWAAPEGETPPAGSEATSPGSIDPAEAFAWARKLWEAGDHAAALPLFRRALAVTGSPNARLYVARCLRELGRLPEAHEEMARTVREAMAQAEKEERYVPTRDAAATELALLERRIGRLVVALDSSLAGASVVVNGVALPPDRLGQSVAIPPGAVHIVATGSDGQPVTRDVDVPAGAMLTVTLSAAGSPKVTPQVPTHPPDEDQGDGGG